MSAAVVCVGSLQRRFSWEHVVRARPRSTVNPSVATESALIGYELGQLEAFLAPGQLRTGRLHKLRAEVSTQVSHYHGAETRCRRQRRGKQSAAAYENRFKVLTKLEISHTSSSLSLSLSTYICLPFGQRNSLASIHVQFTCRTYVKYFSENFVKSDRALQFEYFVV